jgi:hypothetical protein
MACQHGVLQFNSGDYYVTCPTCHARWGRLSDDGRPEYRTLEDGTNVGCDPSKSNQGFCDRDQFRCRR